MSWRACARGSGRRRSGISSGAEPATTATTESSTTATLDAGPDSYGALPLPFCAWQARLHWIHEKYWHRARYDRVQRDIRQSASRRELLANLRIDRELLGKPALYTWFTPALGPHYIVFILREERLPDGAGRIHGEAITRLEGMRAAEEAGPLADEDAND